MDFRVILKNANYYNGQSMIETSQVETQVTILDEIFAFYAMPHSKAALWHIADIKILNTLPRNT